MKTIGVMICALCAVSVWGSAISTTSGAPQSFQLICPKNVVVDCHEDLTNLSKWGDAYVLKDYKRQSAGKAEVIDERNSCGIGIITRTWRVEDSKWKWHVCTQIIDVRGSGSFSYLDITWPEDWAVDTCNINTHPGNLPDKYGYPKFKRKDCSQPAYSYKDEVFNFSKTCVKIIRRWKVLDWCNYKPGSKNGIWEHAQIIKIEKGNGIPDFVCPKDTVIYAENCDSADVNLDDLYAVSSCGDTLRILNNSPHADSRVGDASGKYPIGEHTFKYFIEYGCARELKCKVTIKVVDSKPPTPYCKNGIITTLMPIDTNNDGTIDDGMREVWASDLNAGSFHDCDPHRKLIYSFSSDTSDKVINFTCDNIGKNEVEIWVTDEFGNQSYCITYILVQNNNPLLKDCEPDSLIGGTIKGSITLHAGPSLRNVGLNLKGVQASYTIQNGIDTVWEDLDLSLMVNDQGGYRFKKLPMYKEYQLMPERNDDVLNGVDIWDYYALSFHLDKFFRFTDPLQILAADINGDGKVNGYDAVDLIYAILVPDNPAYEFKSWSFYDESRLEDWIRNQSTSFLSPEEYVINNLTEKFNDVMWVGIKMGDFDSSVDLNNFTPNSTTTLRGNLHANWKQSNTNVNLWTLQLNPEIVAGDVVFYSEGEGQFEFVENDKIFVVPQENGTRVAWAKTSQEGHSLQIQLKDGVGIEEIKVRANNNKVYNHEGHLSSIVLRSDNDNYVLQSEVLQVFPNPAESVIHIEWQNISDSESTFKIYNSTGQLVQENYKGSFDKGIALTQLDIKSLESGNTYFFKINQGDTYCTGSFVKR